MKKLKWVVLALVVVACGSGEADTGETVEIVETAKPVAKDPVMALRDSAMQIAYGSTGTTEYKESLRLLDEAMALDPGNRQIFYSQMQVLSKYGSDDELFDMQVRLDTLDFKDGYTTLQLGVEYELRGDQEKADAKYHDAINIFAAVLDTMQNRPHVSRNNYILNLATAEALVQNSDEKLHKVMNADEKQYLKEIVDQINNAKRADLLEMNRKKTK